MTREQELAARADALARRSGDLREELAAGLSLAAMEARPVFEALRIARRYAWAAGLLLRLAGRSGGSEGRKGGGSPALEQRAGEAEDATLEPRKRGARSGVFSSTPKATGATSGGPLFGPLVSVVVSGAGIVINRDGEDSEK